MAPSRAHPRSRGEDPREISTQVGVHGLIPARAGRTPVPPSWAIRSGAHPRSRGEDGSRPLGYGRGPGSSPLARGGPSRTARRYYRAGLIPARAGRTSTRRTSPTLTRAHPRSRGEDVGPDPYAWGPSGSSPLARGGLGADGAVVRLPGLIPARAGRTTKASSSDSATGAHPRSRGEDALLSQLLTARGGSSPLARGGHSLSSMNSGGWSIIPLTCDAGRLGGSDSPCSSHAACPRRSGQVRWVSASAGRHRSPLAPSHDGGP